MPPEQEPQPDQQPGEHSDQPAAPEQPDCGAGPDAAARLAQDQRRTRRLIVIRLSLLVVSVAGVLGAAALWAAGRGGLGLRVIAGDLLMILFALLLL